MQPDNISEHQDLPPEVEKEIAPRTEENTDTDFARESNGFLNGAGNLTRVFSELVFEHPQVDLSGDKKEMDALMGQAETLVDQTRESLSVLEPGETRKIIPFPDNLRRDKELEPAEEKLLLEQWQEFNRLKEIPVVSNPLLERAQKGEPEFKQGTLLHGTSFSPEKMKAIKDMGILSGEFVGIAEDSETHYCADFFRVPRDMTVQDYQMWTTERESDPGLIFKKPRMERSRLVTPLSRDKMITFIVDSKQSELASLLKQDAYSQDADPILRNINEGTLLNPKGDEHTRRLSAIPCGIPSNFINGIVTSPALTSEDIDMLRETFGESVTIYSAKGELIGDKKEVSEGNNRIAETEAHAEIKPLYRGVWADKVKEGDLLPVVFGEDNETATSFLEVDTSWMDSKIEAFTRERIDELYKSESGQALEKWVKGNGFKIDPELYNALFYVQMKMKQLLTVSDKQNTESERDKLYFSKDIVKLSELVGRAYCAERAVVGKLLLDKIGIKSSLMGGVHVDGKNYGRGAHAFLILDDPDGDGSLVFDIGRQIPSNDEGFTPPRILRSEKKLEYSTFEGKENYVVPAKNIFEDTTYYYGVGNDTVLEHVIFADDSGSNENSSPS